MTHPITQLRELERLALNRLLNNTPHTILTTHPRKEDQ